MTLEVGCLDKKNVITKDGKMIGYLAGADINPEGWVVPTIIIEVDKDMAASLGLEKSMLKATKTSISTDLIELVGDIIQLKVTTAELKGKI